MSKGRKRKYNEEELKAIAKEETPRIDRSKLELRNPNWMPTLAVHFYTTYEHIELRLQEIDSTAALVGPFRRLKGDSEADGIDFVMLDREPTDLPEMQTFLKCAAGRYVFWRDRPNENKPMIMFVDLKTVPEVTVVGNTVEHAVLDFCDRSTMFRINGMAALKAKTFTLNCREKDVSQMEGVARKVIRSRKENCIGGALGTGRVPFSLSKLTNGYEKLEQDPLAAEHLLRSLRLVGIREQEIRVGVVISKMFDEIMRSVEKGHYENALELGHLLFLANQHTVFAPMCCTLRTVYEKLGFSDFITILMLTLEQREFED